MNYENLNDARKIQEYVTNMRPTFNKRAVFSDETENYRSPAEPEVGAVTTRCPAAFSSAAAREKESSRTRKRASSIPADIALR